MRDVTILLFVGLAASSSDINPSTQAASPTETPSDIEVCDLLTDEQVATVLPGHGGGMEVASGQKLMGTVASYKCSYDVERGNEVDIFTVDLTVGPDALAALASEVVSKLD